jgi:hypothetical protein
MFVYGISGSQDARISRDANNSRNAIKSWNASNSTNTSNSTKDSNSITATSVTAQRPVITQTTANATSRTHAKKANNRMEGGQIQKECKGVKTTAAAETLETEAVHSAQKTIATAGSTAAEMIGTIQT